MVHILSPIKKGIPKERPAMNGRVQDGQPRGTVIKLSSVSVSLAEPSSERGLRRGKGASREITGGVSLIEDRCSDFLSQEEPTARRRE